MNLISYREHDDSFYYWTTPNSHKITIFLEQTTVSDVQTDNHRCRRSVFRPSFWRHRSTTESPAMVDLEPGDGAGPLSVFESGAILQYLAEKTGEFLPKDLPGHT